MGAVIAALPKAYPVILSHLTHVLIAADIVTAAKTGNDEGVAKAEERWRRNADNIAVFLSSENSAWALQTLKDMLYMHLALNRRDVHRPLNHTV